MLMEGYVNKPKPIPFTMNSAKHILIILISINFLNPSLVNYERSF